jgi:putative pyruvate formate lyase activating enzyme
MTNVYIIKFFWYRKPDHQSLRIKHQNSYGQLQPHATKTLEERAEVAISRLQSCQICPRRCGVNRLLDEKGFRRGERHVRIYSYAPHFGEEQPLAGVYGSGSQLYTFPPFRH